MDKILTASVLLLGLHLAGVSGQQKERRDQQVRQSPQSVTVQKGGTILLNCHYEDTVFNYVSWYWQFPGEGPAFLIAIREKFTFLRHQKVMIIIFSKSSRKMIPMFNRDSVYNKKPIPIQSVFIKNKGRRFQIFITKGSKYFSLNIINPQPGDSATYFCAASAQCSPGTCSPYTNLQLRLQQSPAVG